MSDVTKDDLAKALSALSDLAKGHSSRGTKTTEVESMSGEGGSTQIHHTASSSERQSWAGSSWAAVPENGATDSVGEDGTDYSPQGKVVKAIMDKIAKGQQLTASEFTLLKGAMDKDDKDDDKAEKAMPFGKDKDDDKDDDKDMGKSLSDYASEDEDVSKGIEVSEFLAGFAGVIEKSMQALEERVVARLGRHIVTEAQSTGEFQKSLAGAVVALGEAVAGVNQRVSQVESAPARGPKSAMGAHEVQPLEKGGYGGPEGAPLSKAVVANTLVELVQSGEATVQDVLRFETNSELSESLQAKVRARAGR